MAPARDAGGPSETLLLHQARVRIFTRLRWSYRFKSGEERTSCSFLLPRRTSREKLQTQVDFPLEGLDLSRYLLRPQGVAPIYDCYAVSNHYGSLGGGHYTAYCKMPDTHRWHCFDDSHVSEANEEDVTSSAAYVLFYRRRHEASLDPPDQMQQLMEARAAQEAEDASSHSLRDQEPGEEEGWSGQGATDPLPPGEELQVSSSHSALPLPYNDDGDNPPPLDNDEDYVGQAGAGSDDDLYGDGEVMHRDKNSVYGAQDAVDVWSQVPLGRQRHGSGLQPGRSSPVTIRQQCQGASQSDEEATDIDLMSTSPTLE